MIRENLLQRENGNLINGSPLATHIPGFITIYLDFVQISVYFTGRKYLEFFPKLN